MKPTVLVVSEPDYFDITEPRFEMAGYNVIQAALRPYEATEGRPYWPDVLKQCHDKNISISGVLLNDTSVPADDKGLQNWHSLWTQADEKLQEVSKAKNTTHVEIGEEAEEYGLDPKLFEAQINGKIKAGFEDSKEEAIAQLRERKELLEGLLTNTPPSDQGTNLIKALRAENSPFRDTKIVVDFAFKDKQSAFEEAGANAVVTTSSCNDKSSYDLLMNEMNSVVKKNKSFLAEGPKSPISHAKNPRGGFGKNTPQ